MERDDQAAAEPTASPAAHRTPVPALLPQISARRVTTEEVKAGYQGTRRPPTGMRR